MLELTQVRLRAQEAADGLSSVEKTLLDRTTQTLSTIGKESSRRYWLDRLRVNVGSRLLKPQRLMNLSLNEEEHRALMCWRDVDFRRFNMCLGPIQWL